MKKRYFALILLVCLCLAVFGGCFGAKDKEFSKAGMTITLTTRFTEKELISQTAYYESPNALVTVLKESVSSAPAFKDYTLEEYTQAVLSVNKMGNTKIDKPEGKDYYSFTYEKTVNGTDFYYFATTFKTADAFWLIQFACTAANRDKLQESFEKWAGSVTFE